MCSFIREVQQRRDAITKLKQKYPYFSFSILYLYTTPNTPPKQEVLDKSYVFIPSTPDNWQRDIARIQLRDNFPVEYANTTDRTRNICVRSESVSTFSKIKDTLDK